MAKKPTKPTKPPTGTPPDPADEPLNEDQQLFVDEYLIDRNAARAYRTIYPGCSHHNARMEGSRLRHRPNVAREIRAAINACRARNQATADKVIEEIARVATSDIYSLYDPVNGRLRHPRHIPYDARKAIASIKVTRERRSVRTRGRTRTTVTEQEIEYRLWPKMEALGKLCKHLGLDTEITPLEALFRALPPDLAVQVRNALMGPSVAIAPSVNGHQQPVKG